jgi:predicted aspartyl protease
MSPRLPRPLLPLALFALLPFAGCASLNRIAVTSSSPMDWNGHSRIELPMELDSVGRPTVPAKVMGQEAMVLVDSGGGWPSMTHELAAAAGARTSGSTVVNGVSYATAAGVPVQLGRGTIELQKVAIGEQTAETQFALGPELFLQAIVDMDFDSGRMTLIRPDAWTPPPAAPVPLQLWWTKPTVQLNVNGNRQPVCAVVDTGFNSGVALSGAALGALSVPQARAQTTITGFGGVRWQASSLEPLREVGFSSQRYEDVPVSEKKSAVEWECPNLLGMAVLSQHRVIFDLRNRRMWLLPRTTSLVSSR